MNWRLLICSVVALMIWHVAAADTLIVAGHSQQLTSPLVVEKGEVLAPVVPTLRLLGATVAVKDAALTITMPGHAPFHVTAGATTMTARGQRVALPVAPREIEGVLYLPVKALAPLLDAEVQFDAATRTLALHPLLTVSYELRPEGLAVLVRSAAPLQFTSGSAAEPPRLYFDFKHAALGMAEQHIPVNAGRVERVRIAQHSLSPSVVRLVADCLDPSAATTTVEEQGRVVVILVGKPVEKPVPAPTQPETPKPLDPTQVLGITLSKHSAKQSEVNIATAGPTQLDSRYRKDTRQLTLTVQNGINAIPADRLRELRDSIVEKIETSASPAGAGMQVTVTFTKDAGYLLQQEPQNIRVLVGTFDISDMTIVLDAGHGGNDVGAVGVNRLYEKDVNLDVVLRAGKLLERAGARVIYTRNDDTFIPLNDRPALANRRGADIFISVHCNAMPKPNTASGTQTYYHTPQSAKLAAAMHEELVSGLGLKNGGVRTAGYLVIRKSLMPSVLLELAFINNTQEEALLASADFRQKAAEAILNGVRRYAATKDWQLRKSELPPSLGTPNLANTLGVE